MEEFNKRGQCGLTEGVTCPGGHSTSRCCYVCKHKDNCEAKCLNYPDKCNEFVKPVRNGLDDDSIRKMQEEHQSGMSIMELAEKYRVTYACMHYRLNKKL